MKKIRCEMFGIAISFILLTFIFTLNGQEISISAGGENRGIIRIWMFGLLISMGLGNFIVRIVMKCLRAKLCETTGRFTLFLGILESFSYTVAWVIGAKQFIAIWLGLKMAGRWSTKEGNSEKGGINSFLIGNLLMVIFSAIAGITIKYILKNGWNLTVTF